MARIAAGTLRDVKVIGLVSFGHMMSHFYFLILPPILLLLKDEFHTTFAALGLLMTAFAVAGGLAQTPVGFLVDRIGGRRVLVWGLLIEGLCIAAIGATDALWQVFVLYTVAGLANAVFHPADYAIISASVARERLGRAFSVHLFSGNLGFALAPVTMGLLTALWDWRTAFLATGAIGVVLALYMGTQGALFDQGRGRETRNPSRTEAGKGQQAESGLTLLFSFPILMCLLFFIMMTLGFTGIRAFSVTALNIVHGTSLAAATTALTGFLMFSSIGILAGGVLADRIGPQVTTAVVTLVAAGALVLVVGAVPMGIVPLTLVMSASGFLQGLLMPTRDLLIRAVTPDGSMGKVVGFLSTGMMAASGVVPALFGWLMDVGAADYVFWLSGIFVIGALVSFASARGRAASRMGA